MYTFPIPSPNSITKMADWIELYIAANKTNLSKSEIKSFINLEQGSEPTEYFMDDVFGELERRKILYGRNPPFKIIDDGVAESNIDCHNNSEYLFCLILAVYGNIHDVNKDAKLFEKISNEAIKKYLKAKTVLFGYPQSIPILKLTKMMSEIFLAELSMNSNDRKVDIVAWIPFRDKRSTQAIFLFQCAAGNNWRQKTRDVPLEAWENCARWKSPYLSKGFCTVHTISTSLWLDCADEAGILIDRPRIFKNIRNIDLRENLREILKNRCESILNTYT